MQSHWKRLLVYAITVFFLASACLSTPRSAVPSARTSQGPTPESPVVTIRVQTPILAPISTATPIPTPSLTPLPTPTTAKTPTYIATPSPTESLAPTPGVTPEPIIPPLPGALLNLSSTEFPLSTCMKGMLPGQIWYASYPYSAARVLASDAQIGFYEPRWSPKYDWIAYVAVNPTKAQETVFNSASIIRQFADSDSIWIMRPDGSGRRRISQSFPRVDFETAGGSCRRVGGIVSLVGWSPDSQWLTFNVFSPKKDAPLNISNTLYLVNTQTGELRLAAHEAYEAHWQPDSDKLAAVLTRDNTTVFGPTVAILAVGQSDISPEKVSLPSQLPAEYTLEQLQWDQDGHSLLVLGVDRSSSFNFPMTLWRVDVATKTWTKITSLQSDNLPWLSFGTPDVTCSDFPNSLELRDPNDWSSLSTLKAPDGAACETMARLKDGAGSNLLGFVDSWPGEEIWVASLSATSPVAHEIINGTTLKFPRDYGISYIGFSQGDQP